MFRGSFVAPHKPILRRNKSVLTFAGCMLLLLSQGLFMPLRAQDSLRLTIDQAESQFLQKNLLVLAQKCQVQRQEALIIQARTFQNPSISANFNLYDPENDIFLHTGATGQKDFMIQQLIQLGGKRRLNIEMAKLSKAEAEAEFTDLLRNLRFQLHSAFFTARQQYNNILTFDKQLQLLDNLITAYSTQAAKGNVSMKDLIRLKSSYLNINSEKSESVRQMNDAMATLNLLIGEKAIIIPQVSTGFEDQLLKETSLADLENQAMTARPDLSASNQQMQYSVLDLRYQKKAVVPDATFNLATDQRGGAFRNQVNFGVAMDLPLLNQNRGNILAAKAGVQQSTYLADSKKQEVVTEVLAAWQDMKRSTEEYQKSKALYDEDFSVVLQGLNDNFRKGNLSIIEFIDFLESYNDALKEIERIKNQMAINAAKINYVTATKIY